MTAIANWQLSMEGLGSVQIFSSEFRYAGGIAIIGFGSGGGTGFEILHLGNDEIALMTSLTDQNGAAWNYYWNSHYSTAAGSKNSGMMVFNSNDNYESSSIGGEQTFKLINLGEGKVALQATAGAFQTAYLGGQQAGWYAQEWSLGSGSLLSVSSPAAFEVQGDLLPILLITNSAYKLNLAKRSLAGIALTNANMQGCILNGADLSKITGLQGADFTDATLSGAFLSGQNLTGANWTGANFTNTDLSGIAGAAGAQMPGTVFDSAHLQGRNLAGAHLAGASFKDATLDNTDFSGADLTGANLSGASLKGTIFRGARLHAARFDGCVLSTAQFDAAPDFARTTAGRTTFVGATVPFAVLANNWSYLDLTSAIITGLPKAISTLVADHALLPDGLDLGGIDLSGASFVGAQMYEIQLQKANLAGANLTNALLKGAKLNSANLTLANFDSAYLIAEQSGSGGIAAAATGRLEAAVATNAFMFNTILDGAHCDGVDFSGAVFVTAPTVSSRNASAVGASMNFVKFNGAEIVKAVFNGAQLSGADFSQAIMTGASFLDNGTTPAQLTPSSDVTHTPASVYHADIRGANFTGANMDGLEMRGAIVSTGSGEFEKIYIGFDGKPVPVAFTYGATLLGNTTSGTTCPDGSNGPCRLSAATVQTHERLGT